MIKRSSSPETVYLVGAGPGDPELLTVKAMRLLERADVVMHDSLIDERVLEDLSQEITIRNVGKRPGPDGTRTTQAEINELLVEHARAGDRVVRLKGGDPTVYGRGGEEAEYLAAAEVPFEMVPGVTSAVGVPGAAGIPLTHREHASAVTVITGHEDPTKPDSALDWDALAATVRAGGTLVILMGVRSLPRNVRALQEREVRSDIPVALIEKGTWDDETVVTGTLSTIVDAAEGIEPPAITVIGDVVAVRSRVRAYLQGGAASSELAQTILTPGTEETPPELTHQS